MPASSNSPRTDRPAWSSNPDNTVATVTVTSPTASVAPGSSVQFTATPRNAAGTVLTGFTATWTTSFAAVATVDGDGLVTGVANGTATITATISGKTGDRDITGYTPAQMAMAVDGANQPGAWLFYHKVLETGGAKPPPVVEPKA